MEYNNNVGKNTIEEIYKLFDNGYAMREISEKFNTSFSYVQKLIKSRNYEQQLNENYSQREGFKIIAVCKKTNKSFDDYMNKSGTITKHLKSIFGLVNKVISRFIKDFFSTSIPLYLTSKSTIIFS